MSGIFQASPEKLRRHLEAVARPRDLFENPAGLLAVQQYIEDELRSYGYKTEKHPFSFQGQKFENVLARTGRAQTPAPPKRFIIGAHFDAVPGTDGADDNASGVAGLLEAARLLAQSPAADSIDFLAFNAEEYGMVGSGRYVRDHCQGKNRAGILGMISLEMIGFTSQKKGSQQLPSVLKPFYPDTGNFLALVGDGGAKKLLKTAAKAFQTVPGLPVQMLTVPVKGWLFVSTRLSDHSPFWDAGIPALLVTDTSFFRNPHYHLDSDKPATLDFGFMAKVTEGVCRLAADLFSI